MISAALLLPHLSAPDSYLCADLVGITSALISDGAGEAERRESLAFVSSLGKEGIFLKGVVLPDGYTSAGGSVLPVVVRPDGCSNLAFSASAGLSELSDDELWDGPVEVPGVSFSLAPPGESDADPVADESCVVRAFGSGALSVSAVSAGATCGMVFAGRKSFTTWGVSSPPPVAGSPPRGSRRKGRTIRVTVVPL